MVKKKTKKFEVLEGVKERMRLKDGTKLEWVPSYEEQLQYTRNDIDNDRPIRIWHTFRSKRFGGKWVRIEIKPTIEKYRNDSNDQRPRAKFKCMIKGKKYYLYRSHITVLCITGFAIADPRHWVIDHKDGNTLNDRPSNLQVIRQRENCARSERLRENQKLSNRARKLAAEQRRHWRDERRQQLINIHAEALAAGDMDMMDIEFELSVEMNEGFFSEP